MEKKIIFQNIIIFIISVILLAFSPQTSVLCQETNPFGVWELTLGKGDVNQLKSIIQTEEGNYLAGGWTDYQSLTDGKLDGWVVELDSEGNIQWEKTFGNEYDDLIYDVIQTQDKGYLLAGWTENQDGNTDAWILKLGKEGKLEWEKQYDLSKTDKIYSIIQSRSGDYIAIGCSQPEDHESSDALIMSIDINGNIKWRHSFGGEQEDYLNSVAENFNGHLFLAGYTKSMGQEDADGWIVKFNQEGDKEWDKTFRGTEDDRFYSIIPTNDNGYAVLGYTKSKGAGGADMWVLKFDENDHLQWDKTIQESDRGYDAEEDDRGYAIIQDESGYYIVAGYTCSDGEGKADARIMKLDPEGNVVLRREHGGKEDESLSSIVESRDGHFLFAGYTQSKEAGKTSALLLNLDERTNFCLGEDLAVFSPENLQHEQDFENYTIKIFRDLSSVIQIFQNDSLVYTMDGHVFYIQEIGDDITGDGEPNLIIQHWSGGNHMAYANFILSLGEQIKHIYTFASGELKDLNGDEKKEIIEWDESLAYWNACHACSPMWTLIYEFDDGTYHLSPDLMYKDLPSEEELEEMREIVHAESKRWEQLYIKSNDKHWIQCWMNGDVFIPPETWGYMMDFISTGYPDEAFVFLDSVWPENKLGKNVFIKDFLPQLKWTVFYDDVQTYADPPISNAEKTYMTGWEAYRKKDYQKAISSFKDLLEMKPDYEAAIHLLGWSYLQTDRFDEASEAFQRTIELNDKYCYVYYHIGRRLMQEKSYEEAIEAFNQAAITEYAGYNVYSNLGKCYSNLEMYKEAIGVYEKAFEHAYSCDYKAIIYSEIAYCYYELENYDLAKDYLYQAIEFDNKYEYAHFLLGYTLYQIEDNVEGLKKEYNILLELNSSYAERLKRMIDTIVEEQDITTINGNSGNINITSTPSGANIWLSYQRLEETQKVNSEYIEITGRTTITSEGIFKYEGITPLTLSNLKFGTYKIILELHGYKDYHEEVTVYSGKTTEKHITLLVADFRPNTGKIEINSTPASAKVFLDDGYYIGKTPMTAYNIPPGKHKVTLVLADYEKNAQEVEVIGGKIIDVKATLVSTKP